MAAFLLLSDAPAAQVLPALRTSGLDHKVEPLGTSPVRVAQIAPLAVLVDCSSPGTGFTALLDLHDARLDAPLVAVVPRDALGEHGWDTVADELLSPDITDVELGLRISMLRRRHGGSADDEIRLGTVVIHPHSYKASNRGQELDLTFKEFELLRYLAANPGRVFTREALLREVWGYDFYGGTRTVDVHIRRLRAKLGIADEGLIETVRSVGYRAAGFVL